MVKKRVKHKKSARIKKSKKGHKIVRTHRKHKVKAVKKAKPIKLGKEVGKITHWFDKISVGVIKLKAPLKQGATIRIHGHTTNFTQKVASMQLNCKQISLGKRGNEIGIKVKHRVRDNDKVYLA